MSCCTLLLAAALAVAPDPTSAGRYVLDDDVQDLVFFGERRPVVIRLHVRVDGKPYYALWENFLRELFAYCDRDGNGVLSQAEADLVPAAQQMQPNQRGFGFGFQGAAPRMTDLDTDPADGKVTGEELAAYYRRAGIGAIQELAPAGGNTADQMTQVLYYLLDSDKDGRLSKDEFGRAEKGLRSLDQDDDEAVSLQELINFLNVNRAVVQAGGGQVVAPGSPLVIVPRDTTARQLTGRLTLAQRLVTRYDRDRNQKLSREEIDLDKAFFERLDGNGDGELDNLELVRFLLRPAEFEAAVRLGKTGDQETPLALLGTSSATARVLGPEAAALALEGNQITVRRGDPQFSNVGGNRQAYVQQFKIADKNGDGVLDKEEVNQPQFRFLQTLFRMADRDGDGRVAEAELTAFFALQEKASRSVLSLAIIDSGRGLFDQVDANRDGRLGVRELRTAWPRLAGYDTAGKGSLGRDDIPREFRVNLNLGQPNFGGQQQFGGGERPATPPAAAVAGPLWFHKMDRNGDGDLSRREFLGARTEFDRLDADGDGLVSVAEAERFDAEVRKRGEDKR